MKRYYAPFTGLMFIIFLSPAPAQNYYDTSVKNPLTDANVFVKSNPVNRNLPEFKSSRSNLPEPLWPARPDVISCYWKTWEIAFKHLRNANVQNGFIRPYITPAFNDHIFMWDTCFMMFFGRYGRSVFNFQESLDNFYRNQHKDGFISREISELDGTEIFSKYDPSSTGPNILPWAEWDYYKVYRDKKRLQRVFPVLLAYYDWFKANRSWKDGSYYATGWACGMDNQPRVEKGYNFEFTHGFMSWIDTTLQQIFAGNTLIAMAKELDKNDDVQEVESEVKQLTAFVQKEMWNKETSFFYDKFRDGSLSDVKSIASYWALLADVVRKDEAEAFIKHLENSKEFARLHRIPSLSADVPGYSADGEYWKGGVWAPTNYMVLRGLTKYGRDSLAHEIALNNLNNVVKVFTKTGTLWENYAPDLIEGRYRKDMVGWSGLIPISILFEYVFGISQDREDNMIVWDIRLLDEFGIKQYPVNAKGVADFYCGKRRKLTDKPTIKITSTTPFKLKILWRGGEERLTIRP